MIQRCDVVIVEFPYTDAAQSKVRPAVVVLNEVAVRMGTSKPMNEEASLPLDVTSFGSERMRARFCCTRAFTVVEMLSRVMAVPQ